VVVRTTVVAGGGGGGVVTMIGGVVTTTGGGGGVVVMITGGVVTGGGVVGSGLTSTPVGPGCTGGGVCPMWTLVVMRYRPLTRRDGLSRRHCKVAGREWERSSNYRVSGPTRLAAGAATRTVCASRPSEPITISGMSEEPISGPWPASAHLELTSVTNPRVKSLVGLRRRRQRDQLGLMLVEGYEELTLALSAGVVPRTLYYCPELVRDDGDLRTVAEVAALGSEIVRVGTRVFEKVAYRESPDGWLAVVATVPTDLAGLRLPDNPLTLVCESVEKPGNLGAMLRTADAVGVSAVVAAQPITDWGNPNVVRASKGTVFSVPVAAAGSAEVLAWAKEHSMRVVAATPDTDVVFTDVDLSGPTMVAVGSEKHGLSPAWLDAADVRVRIPMFGQANSLNVATSAAIILYEALRQRTATKP
jgi:TrmH family RNA methyltransferase